MRKSADIKSDAKKWTDTKILLLFYFNKYKRHLSDFGVGSFFFFSLLVDQESEQRGVKLGFGRHVGPLPQPEDPLRRREEQTLLIQAVLKDKTRKQSVHHLI